MRRDVRLIGTGLLLAFFVGLGKLAAGEPPSTPLRFQDAIFFKPLEPAHPAFQLAPLLIQEVKGDSAISDNHYRFGRPVPRPDSPETQTNRPVIYFHADEATLAAKNRQRFSYLWCYPEQTNQAWQGIRITLNSTGQPVVWEALAPDASGKELIFVSRSLEDAASAAFGKPLPGRASAIETGTNTAPHVHVARVIDDGPVPMGPIIYLEAHARAISTVVCRCMASEAKNIVETVAYELRPFAELGAMKRPKGRYAYWPGERERDPRIARSLRLPQF